MALAGFQSWQDWYSNFLMFGCLVLLIYTSVILIKEKIYKAYSTFVILASLNLLLISRVAGLAYFNWASDVTSNANKKQYIYALGLDCTTYLVTMIMLPLLWQWFRILRWLTKPFQAQNEEESGLSLWRLVAIQTVLTIIWFLDISILYIHYDKNLWHTQAGTKINPTWEVIRITTKGVFLLITVIMIVLALILFCKMRKLILNQYQEMRKQVYNFFTVLIL